MAKPRGRRAWCNAPLKDGSGNRCRKDAGAGTNHLGIGRCFLHGGNQQREVEKAEEIAINPELYEALEDKTIRKLYEHAKKTIDPTNTLDELALLRAITVNFVNRAEEMQDALLAWYASFTREFKEDWDSRIVSLIEAHEAENWEAYRDHVAKLPNPIDFQQRPRQVIDLSEAVKLLNGISILADRIDKRHDAGSIPVKYLLDLFGEMIRVFVDEARDSITDPVERSAFIARVATAWGELQIRGGESTLGPPEKPFGVGRVN